MREPFERAVSPRQCAANLSLSLQLNTKGKKIEEVNGSEEESMALVETSGSNWTLQQDSLPTKFALFRSSLHIHSW